MSEGSLFHRKKSILVLRKRTNTIYIRAENLKYQYFEKYRLCFSYYRHDQVIFTFHDLSVLWALCEVKVKVKVAQST